MDEAQAAARAEYEAALDWHTLARKELANARHLLKLAEQNMDRAEDALCALESSPGIARYVTEARQAKADARQTALAGYPQLAAALLDRTNHD